MAYNPQRSFERQRRLESRIEKINRSPVYPQEVKKILSLLLLAEVQLSEQIDECLDPKKKKKLLKQRAADREWLKRAVWSFKRLRKIKTNPEEGRKFYEKYLQLKKGF